MAKRLAVATLGVTSLTYMTSPLFVSIFLGLIAIPVVWGQWLSHSRRKCVTLRVDDSVSS